MLIDVEKEVELKYKERTRTPDILGPVTDLFRLIDYFCSDQEKEGREYAIKFAAMLYRDSVVELEESICKIKDRLIMGHINFYDEVNRLKERLSFYNTKIDELDEKINKLINNNNLLDKFHTEYRCNRFLALTEFSQYKWNNGSNIENLDDKMERKRRKYFDIELKIRIKMWEDKIDELKNEKRRIIESFKLTKQKEKEILLRLIDETDLKHTEYVNKIIEYNALNCL